MGLLRSAALHQKARRVRDEGCFHRENRKPDGGDETALPSEEAHRGDLPLRDNIGGAGREPDDRLRPHGQQGKQNTQKGNRTWSSNANWAAASPTSWQSSSRTPTRESYDRKIRVPVATGFGDGYPKPIATGVGDKF